MPPALAPPTGAPWQGPDEASPTSSPAKGREVSLPVSSTTALLLYDYCATTVRLLCDHCTTGGKWPGLAEALLTSSPAKGREVSLPVSSMTVRLLYDYCTTTVRLYPYFRNLVSELQQVDLPNKLHVDNLGAGFIARNEANNRRTKRIDIGWHMIQGSSRQGACLDLVDEEAPHLEGGLVRLRVGGAEEVAQQVRRVGEVRGAAGYGVRHVARVGVAVQRVVVRREEL
eukprot:840942-Pyramimonas_sp.AAC.1